MHPAGAGSEVCAWNAPREPGLPENTAAPSVTVFTSDRAPLGKRFWLAEGEIRKESFATFYAGKAETRQVASASDLATLLEGLSSRQALAAGVLTDGTYARIGTRAKAKQGERVRSLTDFAFPRAPGWFLWDYDPKSMPAEVAARVEALGGPLEALFRIWPEAKAGPYVIRPSSSDGVTAPGCEALRSTGLHGFFLIENVSQSRAVLETLQARAWDAGLAWCTLSKAGSVLIRSIVDVAVGSPERLIFEAPPILVPPVTRLTRQTIVHDAPLPLRLPETPLEVAARAAQHEAAARLAIKPEAQCVEQAFVEERAQAEAVRTGKPIREARRSIRQMMRGAVLEDDHLLRLGNGDWVRVGDILDATDRWDRQSIPDPIEGLAYGRDKATLLLRSRAERPDEKPALVSHAHGQRTVYRFARYEAAPSLPPFHPAPDGDRQTNLDAHRGVVRRFFREALPPVRAMKEVARAYATLDEVEDLEPGLKVAQQRRIRQEVQLRWNLEHLPSSRQSGKADTPRVMLTGAQGVGKTQAMLEGLQLANDMVTLVLAPDHEKAREMVGDLAQMADGTAPAVLQLKGRGAMDGATGETMCLNPKTAQALGARGLSVPQVLCLRCPFRDRCGYLAQETRLQRLVDDPQGVIVVAAAEYAFLPLPGRVEPDLVVFDEAPRSLGLAEASISFDTLGEPLVYEKTKQAKGRVGEAAEAADAHAANLAILRPTRIALRDAFQETPETALRTLRERGVDEKRLQDTLDALTFFEDRAIAEKLGGVIDGYTFALLNGKQVDLDKRLIEALEEHEGEAIKDFRAICRALLVELRHGRDEPVGVRRAENINPPGMKGLARKGIRAYYLQEPHFGRNVPFLHLDGTGEHKLAEQLFGPLRLECHRVERPAQVVQVIGRAFSNKSIIGTNRNGQPIPSREVEAKQLRGELLAYCHAHPGALVVGNRRVVETLKKDSLRNPVAHYKALRGRNEWKDLSDIIVIGREQPSTEAVENHARAYAAKAGDPLTSLHGGHWHVEDRGLRMRDGSTVSLEVECHPDPWCDLMLRQIREAEILQAIDRLRPHFKDQPVNLHLLCPVVLDVTVDRVERWIHAKQGGTRVARAFEAAGFLPLSNTEAVRLLPEIWRDERTAGRDLKPFVDAALTRHFPYSNLYMESAELSGTALCEYQAAAREGGRVGRKHLVIVAGSPQNARAKFEAAAGPLHSFTVVGHQAAEQAKAATPALAPTLAAAEPIRPTGTRRICRGLNRYSLHKAIPERLCAL